LNDPDIEVTQHIASNHMDMCRFNGPDDAEYVKVAGALNRVLEATANLAPLDMRSVLNADQRRSYLNSLWFDQIDARRATIKTAHAKTCRWLLSNSEYQAWLDVNKILDHHGFLWISGKPGTGKSTIMKFAYVNAMKKMTDTIIISYFFNARGEHLEKSALGMYRSLLFQLLEKLPELQNLFDPLGPTVPNKGDFYRWDTERVKSLFSQAIENLGQHRLTCFIDALDECEEDQVREMVAFFEHLGQLAASDQFQFHVCFSSRHYPHITINKSIRLILEGQEGHQQDIVNYLHSELRAGHSKLVGQIKAEIVERASGIFLWVVLVVQMLNKEYDRGRIHALRRRLDEIPNGLDELFKGILTRDGQNMADLILCLQWILYAKRPLKREELYFAILAGVEPEAATAWSPEDITKQDMERFILSSSKGLAEVTKSKNQTVQFIHESVRDFLLKGNGLCWLQYDLGSNFPALSHERLRQCCQNYMRIDLSDHLPFSEPLSTASSEEVTNLRRLASERFPFLEYAVRNVLYHADTADGYGASQDAFVDSFPLRDWITLNNLYERYQIRRYTSNGSLLYILAEENLPNLIRIELKRVPHMDIEGERYGFPLLAALANANENAVREFLIQDTSAWPDSDITYNHLPCPTDGDVQEVVRFLLKNRRDFSSRKDETLLSWAAERGDMVVVKVLLGTRKVDINSQTKSGLTPLSRAAEQGHGVVVQLLLACSNVEVNSKDRHGRTPLRYAAGSGHEDVVKLLLARPDVEVNSKGNSGRTPLSWAANQGHEAVVKLLLARSDVEANSKENDGHTPLSLAAKLGREEVVKLLLARPDVEVNLMDNYGNAPLSLAAKLGREEVVKLLLARPDVEVNSKGNSGRTPLSWAANQGHEAVVKLLLARSDIKVNSENRIGRTPLSWAVVYGHEEVVKLLLARPDIEVNSKESGEWTPLSLAVSYAHEEVVKLLLARPDVEVNSKGNSGRTPLSLAAVYGHEEVVKLLLARPDVEVNSKGNSGRTPLAWAKEQGHMKVVELLQPHISP
jgi:ankyrin repeat protein